MSKRVRSISASPSSSELRDTALWWDVVADRTDADGDGSFAEAAAREPERLRIGCATSNPLFAPLTGVTRANLVYAYAFVPTVQP